MNVAFLIYNRPTVTARVFAEIAKARPERLLIVADGPRDEEDDRHCRAARAAVANIEWPCTVLRNYADANMGCRRRVASGLDWVFSEVEESVILEDDCLPHPTFFKFCTDLLERYRQDERVGHIGGFRPPGARLRAPHSYNFSLYPMIWGWASWRRAWRDYDVELRAWPELKRSGRHQDMFPSRETAEHFEIVWDHIHTERLDTWDGQWLFARVAASSLSITPGVNLISNIGFTEQATHTTGLRDVANTPVEPMAFPLRHPPCLVPDRQSDLRIEELFYRHKRRFWEPVTGRLMNKYWYGTLVRSVPGIGGLWARCRDREIADR